MILQKTQTACLAPEAFNSPMEKTEVFLKDKVVLDQQGQPRKAFYDLTFYKDARSVRIAQEYYDCSTAFIDEQGNECFFLHNTVISFK